MSQHYNAHRTVIVYEVMGNDPYCFTSLDDLAYEVTNGALSGRLIQESSTPVSDAEAQRLMDAHGSDVDFLGEIDEEPEEDGVVPGDDEDPDYPEEVAVMIANGCQIRVPAYPHDCSYVRVIDASGQQSGYWTFDEWAEEPEEVMGAIFGAALSTLSVDDKPQPSRHPR